MMLDNPANLLNTDTNPDDDTLRQYLRQYTYIDYKAADWLDKLVYALPMHGMMDRSCSVEQSANDDQELIAA